MGYDVAIIGCGVHGAAAAFALAERGVRVAVIDKDVPAGGPTGRSSAVIRGYYVNEFLARATRESLEVFKAFTEITHGGEARFVGCGALFLHGPEDGERLHEAAARLNALGTKTEVFTAEQLAGDFPIFDLDGIAWAAWEPDAGHADPAGTTLGLVNRAVELGAELIRHSRVTAIRREPTGYTLDLGGERTLQADKVLLAAGPWTSRLLAMVGVADYPLWAERHIIATYLWGAATPVPYVWASIPEGIYFKPELHAQYLVGTLWEEGRVDPDDFDHELASDDQLRITEALLKRAPALEDSEARSGYAALYDVAPDWQPVIGEIAEDLFVVAGTAGHGFKWAPAIGRHVADLITGADVDAGLAQFGPDRFARGEHLEAGYGEARILG